MFGPETESWGAPVLLKITKRLNVGLDNARLGCHQGRRRPLLPRAGRVLNEMYLSMEQHQLLPTTLNQRQFAIGQNCMHSLHLGYKIF